MNYGEFGGQYVSPQLKEKLNFIKKSFNELKKQKEFKEEYLYYLKNFYVVL